MRKQLSRLIRSAGALALVVAGVACSRSNTSGPSIASPSGFGPTQPATQNWTSTENVENTQRVHTTPPEAEEPTAMGGGPSTEGSGSMGEGDAAMDKDVAVNGAVEGTPVAEGDQTTEKD